MSNIISMIILLAGSALLSGCSMWPYKSDFDCPLPEGEKCKSLYEVHKMADQGKFDPNNPDNQIDHMEKVKCCGKRNCKARSN